MRRHRWGRAEQGKNKRNAIKSKLKTTVTTTGTTTLTQICSATDVHSTLKQQCLERGPKEEIHQVLCQEIVEKKKIQKRKTKTSKSNSNENNNHINCEQCSQYPHAPRVEWPKIDSETN